MKMIDGIVGFAGGSVTGFVASIFGFVNLDHLIEVFIITLVGGFVGGIGNWLWRLVVNNCKKLKSKKITK